MPCDRVSLAGGSRAVVGPHSRRGAEAHRGGPVGVVGLGALSVRGRLVCPMASCEHRPALLRCGGTVRASGVRPRAGGSLVEVWLVAGGSVVEV